MKRKLDKYGENITQKLKRISGKEPWEFCYIHDWYYVAELGCYHCIEEIKLSRVPLQ